MRHGVSGYKLKRDAGSRKALLKGLVTSVIEHERVITTVPKAKAVQPLVDKMITLAKRDTLHTRRQAAAFLETPAAVQKLFDKLGTRFGQRNGGYTRVVRLGFRKGDGAEQAMLELVGSELVKRAAERAKRREEKLKRCVKAKKKANRPKNRVCGSSRPYFYSPAVCSRRAPPTRRAGSRSNFCSATGRPKAAAPAQAKALAIFRSSRK